MIKVDKELIDPMIEPGSEKLHRVTRATIASIPVLGPVAFECFNTLIQPPMEKRQTNWMLQVTDAINELYKKGVVTEKELQENEAFFTTLVNASNTAIRNHEKEKLDSLKYAVLNSALPSAPNDTKQRLFLNFIDSFTSLHIILLKFFRDPKVQMGKVKTQFETGGVTKGIDSVIEHAYPDLKDQKELYNIILENLYSNGLLNTRFRRAQTSSAEHLLSKLTTEFGDEFLTFISQPPM